MRFAIENIVIVMAILFAICVLGWSLTQLFSRISKEPAAETWCLPGTGLNCIRKLHDGKVTCYVAEPNYNAVAVSCLVVPE